MSMPTRECPAGPIDDWPNHIEYEGTVTCLLAGSSLSLSGSCSMAHGPGGFRVAEIFVERFALSGTEYPVEQWNQVQDLLEVLFSLGPSRTSRGSVRLETPDGVLSSDAAYFRFIDTAPCDAYCGPEISLAIYLLSAEYVSSQRSAAERWIAPLMSYRWEELGHEGSVALQIGARHAELSPLGSTHEMEASNRMGSSAQGATAVLGGSVGDGIPSGDDLGLIADWLGLISGSSPWFSFVESQNAGGSLVGRWHFETTPTAYGEAAARVCSSDAQGGFGLLATGDDNLASLAAVARDYVRSVDGNRSLTERINDVCLAWEGFRTEPKLPRDVALVTQGEEPLASVLPVLDDLVRSLRLYLTSTPCVADADKVQASDIKHVIHKLENVGTRRLPFGELVLEHLAAADLSEADRTRRELSAIDATRPERVLTDIRNSLLHNRRLPSKYSPHAHRIWWILVRSIISVLAVCLDRDGDYRAVNTEDDRLDWIDEYWLGPMGLG